MIRLVYVPSILHPHRRTIRHVDPAPTVAELLEREGLQAPHWNLVRNGRRATLEDELEAGDELVAVRQAASGLEIWPIIITAIITAVVGAGVSYLINLLLGPKVPEVGDEAHEGRPTYSWAGMRNTRVQGAPIPIVYGRHRIAGHIIQEHRRNSSQPSQTNSGRAEHLYLLICLGHGPLEEIGGYAEDMNALGPSQPEEDDFSDYVGTTPLADTYRWTRVGGGALDGVYVTSNQVWFVGDEDAVKIDADLDINSDNCYAEATVDTYSDVGARICINLEDEDNYHYIEPISSTTFDMGKRVAGVDTVLLSAKTYAVGDVIRIERYDDTLEAFADGTSVGTAAADSNLSEDQSGLCDDGTASSGGTLLDDFAIGYARTLPNYLHINGVDANSYRGVLAWTRLGRTHQPTLPGDFSWVVQTYGINITVEEDWLLYTFHDEVERFQLVFNFPKGLYEIDGNDFDNQTVTVDIEYREDESDTWTAIDDSPFTFEDNHPHRFSNTIFVEPSGGLSGTAQQVRIRRQNSEQGLEDNRIGDKLVLGDVNELLREDRQKYPDLALLALRLRATDELHGTKPTVTSIVKGQLVPTWDGTGDETDPPIDWEYSRNPAWIALHIALSPHGLGNWLGTREIDWPAWEAFADFCDETVTYRQALNEPEDETNDTEEIASGSRFVYIDDATEAAKFAEMDFVRIENEGINYIVRKTALTGSRWELELTYAARLTYSAGWKLYLLEISDEISQVRMRYDGVFDGNTSAWEALLQVCRTARAIPLLQGNLLSVRWEDEAEPVQTISEASMIRDSLEIQYIGSAERPDEVAIQYLDKDQDYDQAQEPAGGFPSSVSREIVRKTEQLYGIVRSEQARREAYYHLLAQLTLRKRVRFELTPDLLTAQAGDVITISSVLPAWTYWTGRVRGTLSRFRISSAIVLEASTTYLANVRTAEHPEGVQVTITSPAGTYDPGSQLDAWLGATGTDPGEDDLELLDAPAAIGPAGSISREYRLISTELTEDLTIRAEAVQYDSGVYELQGWTAPVGVQPVPASGCVTSPGSYFLDFETWGLTCGAEPAACSSLPDGWHCCFVGDMTVYCTGDGCACLEIDEITDQGIIFTLSTGCEGDQFCIHVDYEGDWYKQGCPCESEGGEPDPATCGMTWLDDCDAETSQCFTICP